MYLMYMYQKKRLVGNYMVSVCYNRDIDTKKTDNSAPTGLSASFRYFFIIFHTTIYFNRKIRMIVSFYFFSALKNKVRKYYI